MECDERMGWKTKSRREVLEVYDFQEPSDRLVAPNPLLCAKAFLVVKLALSLF